MPVTLPKKYVLITAGMFWNFTNTFFPRKPDTGYFNYSSFGLKQLSKGKTLTERQSILCWITKSKIFHSFEINKESVS